MLKYCPTCNRSSDEVRFIGEFCEVCVADRLKEKIADSAGVERCKSCERIRTREGYAVPDKNTVKDAISFSMKPKCDIFIDSFDWKAAEVRFRCEVDGEKVAFAKKINIRVTKTMCIDCYRKTSGYYEAIVQLRGDAERCERVMKRLLTFIDRRDTFASRIDELSNGYDLYLSNKKTASAFFEYYDLKPKRSYSLYGLKGGKKIYRNIYLLRFEEKKDS